MDEQKTTEEIKPEETNIDSNTGVQPTAGDKIKQLNEETEGIEDAIAENKTAKGKIKKLNDETRGIEEAIASNENAKARLELGGGSEAGTETKPQYTDEEKASRARIKAVADASGSKWGKEYE